MESSQLVSWQFEDFSTAELSPPSSPASPSSPLFYHDGSNPAGSLKGLNSNGSSEMVSPQSQKAAVLSSGLSSRAQTASNMLNELERLHSFEMQSAFGMNTNEESVDLNMNLFEELADIEYTPPTIQEDNIKLYHVPSISVQPPVAAVTPPPSTEKLSQEYKSIVESLTTTTTTSGKSIAPVVAATTTSSVVGSLEDLIQITGIPTTTVVGDECLVPVEFIGRPSSTGEALGPNESESMDLDGIIISSEMEFINEHELFGLEELSAELIAEEISTTEDNSTLVNGVLPQWAKEITIPLDELDTAMNKNDQTLTALLQGDVSTAKNVILPPIYTQQQVFSPISTASDSIDDCVLEEAEVIEVIEKPAPAPKKTERRGRKPVKKDGLNYVKDKALRKKEQNKTAATRYRQKKKQELAVTLAEEEELQTVHDDLEKEKEKVGSELRMIRSLLRDMLQARKKRPSATPTPASTRLTASSIVQAQRIANRRK